MVMFGAPGARVSALHLATGCAPTTLLKAMRKQALASPNREVELHFVRRILRPAFQPGLR